MQTGQVGALGNRALGHKHQEAEEGRPARDAERAPRGEERVGSWSRVRKRAKISWFKCSEEVKKEED